MRRAVAGSLGSSALIQMVSVVTGVLLARTLGASGRGELAAVLLWPGLALAVGALGVADAITYHVARATAPIRTIVGTSAGYLAAQAVLITAAGFVVVPLALGHYGEHAVRLSWLFLAYVPFFLVIVYTMSVLQGLQRFGEFQLLRTGQIVVPACGLVVLATLSRLGVGTAVGVYLGAYVLMALLALRIVRRVCVGRPAFDRRLARKLGAFAVQSHSSNVSSLLNERLDQFVIAAFLAPAQLGLYVVAVTFTSLTNVVGQSISFVALPAIARERDPRARVIAVRRYVRMTLAAAAIVTAPVVALTPWLLRVFFGGEYVPAATVARVLLVAAVVLTTTRVMQSMLKAAGRPLDAGWSEFIALGVTIAALAGLLPWLGTLGAGIASLLAYSTSAGWTARRAARALELGSLRGLLLAGHGDDRRSDLHAAGEALG